MKLGLVLSATDKMSRVVSQAADKSALKMKKFEKAVSAANSVSNKMFVAGGVIAAGLIKSIKAAEDAASANANLEQTFKTMWGAAWSKDAARAAEKMAEKLEFQIGVDDEVIKLTMAKIATFKNLSSQSAMLDGTFQRVTLAAHDMAAKGFGEASQMAVMLGKAINDPLNMTKALKRTGAIDAGDVVTIESIARVKGLKAAQEALLLAVERQVKGTAEATRKTSDLIVMSVGEISEAIGGVFTGSTDKAKNNIGAITEKITGWIGENRGLIITIAKIAVGLFALGGAIRVITMIATTIKGLTIAFNAIKFAIFAVRFAVFSMNLAFLASPIFWIPAAIAAVGVAVYLCWKKFATFRAVILTVWDTVKGFGNVLKNYVVDRVTGLLSVLGHVGAALSALFQGKFKVAASEALKAVDGLTGVSATVKAVQGTVKVVQSVPDSYNKNLSNEQGVKAKSGIMLRGNNTQTVTYAPVMNFALGASGADVTKASQDAQRDFEARMKKWDLNKNRLAFQ